MNVILETLPKSQIGLQIEITAQQSQTAYDKAVTEFSKSVNIPGFRKGKVPRQVLLQRIGVNRIKASVIEELIQATLGDALKQENIQALGNYKLISEFDDLVKNFTPGQPLTYKAAVDVLPQVIIKDLTQSSIKVGEVKYNPQEIEDFIEKQREEKATLVPVEGRSVQLKDVIVVDYQTRYTDPNQNQNIEPAGSASDVELEIDKDKIIGDLVDQVIGMNQGETKDLDVTFPHDYPQETLQNQQVTFTLTIKDIKQKELPEVNDEWIQEISTMDTLAEFRADLENKFKAKAEEATQQKKNEALLNKLLEFVEVDLPESLIEQEVYELVSMTMVELENLGISTKKLLNPELLEGLKEERRPEAIIRTKINVALAEIARQQSLNPTPEEIATSSQEIIDKIKDKSKIDPDRLKSVVTSEIIQEKVLQWLETQIKVELIDEPEEAATIEDEPEEAATIEDEPEEAATIEDEPVSGSEPTDPSET